MQERFFVAQIISVNSVLLAGGGKKCFWGFWFWVGSQFVEYVVLGSDIWLTYEALLLLRSWISCALKLNAQNN